MSHIAGARVCEHRLDILACQRSEIAMKLEQCIALAACNIDDMTDRLFTLTREEIRIHNVRDIRKVAGLQSIAINRRRFIPQH